MSTFTSITLSALASVALLRSMSAREADREPLFLVAGAVFFVAAGVWVGL